MSFDRASLPPMDVADRATRLRSFPRTWRNIQTTSPRSTGGHIQPSTACTGADPLSEATPSTAIKAAGAAAQRCGWSLNRTDSTASGESNWVQTMPGRHLFSYFRLYGPLETYFDRTWKHGDITAV